MINVTPDGQRTMCTFLGASVEFTDADVDTDVDRGARRSSTSRAICSTPRPRGAPSPRPPAWRTAAGRMIALTLSDGFVVERHRAGADGLHREPGRPAVRQRDRDHAPCSRPTTSTPPSRRSRPHVKLAAVTRSEAGLGDPLAGRARSRSPAEPVEKVVDTTGAGDQYAAGFHVRPVAGAAAAASAASWPRWRRRR